MPLPQRKTPGFAGVGAVADLGLGGALSQQVQDETEEERKKRMRQQQMGMASPAANDLLGGSYGGAGY